MTERIDNRKRINRDLNRLEQLIEARQRLSGEFRVAIQEEIAEIRQRIRRMAE